MNKAMKDTVADWDDKIALIMGTGGASVEEASRALDECGGNVDRAMAQLYGDTKEAAHHETTARTNASKSSRRHGLEEETDESIAKPGVIFQLEGVGHIGNQNPQDILNVRSSEQSSTMSLGMMAVINDQSSPPSLRQHKAHQMSPVTPGAVAVGGLGARTMDGDDEYTLTAQASTQPSPAGQNMSVPVSAHLARDTLAMASVQQHTSSRAARAAINSYPPYQASRALRAPRPITPGAFAVGANVTNPTSEDEYTLTAQSQSPAAPATRRETVNPMEPVTAHVVHDTEQDVEELQQELEQVRREKEQMQREREQMRRERENVVVAQVLEMDEEAQHANENEEETPYAASDNEGEVTSATATPSIFSHCGQPTKKWLVLLMVLAIVGIVVGIVIGVTSSPATDTTPTPGVIGFTHAPTTVSPTSPPPTPAALDESTPAPTIVPATLPPTTLSPTIPPTTAPQDPALNALLSSVSFDGGAALQTPSTPQNMAFLWLAGNANLNSYSDDKKIQRYVLATVYYSTNGDGWRNNIGWLSDDDECTWWNSADGAFCSTNGAVLEFDLWSNNLIGTLPPEVALLSNSLDELTLSDNSLTGTIPSELGLLSSLNYMKLHEKNSLTGTVPSEIGLLSALIELWLYNNALTGTIPSEIGLLTALTKLYLSRNILTGTIPSEIGLLSALDLLALDNNNFTGEFICGSFIDTCYISCWDPDSHNVTSPCRCLPKGACSLLS